MTTAYPQATVYCPRNEAEDFKISITLNRDDGGAQPGKRVSSKLDKACHAIASDALQGGRLLEKTSAERWIPRLTIEPPPGPRDRGWPLAVIVADRMARGVLDARLTESAGKLYVYGDSPDWSLGTLSPLSPADKVFAIDKLIPRWASDDQLILGDREHSEPLDDTAGTSAQITHISHLGMLSGQPDAAVVIRRYRVYFPLVGKQDQVAWVDVTARPRNQSERDRIAAAPDKTEASVLGDMGVRFDQRVQAVLESSRRWDGSVGHHWQTSVRFSQQRIDGNSWQLALVLADRIARRREVAPKGRLFATGKAGEGETDWGLGTIGYVQSISRKLDLIKREHLKSGDRVLLPLKDGEEMAYPEAQALIAAGASVVQVAALRR